MIKNLVGIGCSIGIFLDDKLLSVFMVSVEFVEIGIIGGSVVI